VGLAEDARYWRAVALGRARKVDAARAAMEHFLSVYPTAPRAGEVSAMLGWLLVEAKEPVAAAARFRAAERDASPAVRKSAGAGLAAISSTSPDLGDR
jgi:Tfp pilus assembly protein PilF